ncbi:hypothetical protein EV356DRAFT_14678 [Viridothelium virens]|uniref:NB-ARC domain-containing protein n=1 Tax=Viridothelium virens TaxID=1048519 RepID=A0A6A6HIL3_VIRVR|nr:hypothetical protein EV356DRAFT_14678 [Viridothelium virens]
MSGAEFIAVLGVATSIISCIDAGNKVLKQLREYQEGNVVRQDIIIQLESLVELLDRIPVDQSTSQGGLQEDENLVKLVQGCQRHIKKLHPIIERVSPVETDSKLQRWSKSARFLWKNGEIVQWQRALAEYKASLSLWFSSETYRIAFRVPKIGKGEDAPPSYHLYDTTTLFDVPNKLTTQFVERTSLFDELDLLVSRPQEPPNARITTILGMGGQGKTQLALRYCHEARAKAFYRGIFWINAYDRASIVSSFEKIAELLALDSRRSDNDEEKAIRLVQHHLGKWSSPWLMVFDNFDDPDLCPNFGSFIPPYPNGSVIITSRHSLASVQLAPRSTLRMNGMTDDEALNLLLIRSFQEKNNETQQIGLDIVKRLGHHPLAIDQAAAYIGTKQLPLSRFLSEYDARKENVLKHTLGSWGYSRHLDRQDIALNAYTTWDMSFEQLATDGERGGVLSFLSTLAFLSPSLISEFILSQGTTVQNRVGGVISRALGIFIKDGKWDSIKYEDTLVNLLSLSLIVKIDYGSPDISFSIHPLIADRLRCTEDGPEHAFEATLVIANTVKSYFDLCISPECGLPILMHLSSSKQQELITHVRTCLGNIKAYAVHWTDGQKETAMLCQFYLVDYVRHFRMSRFSNALYARSFTSPIEDIDIHEPGMLAFTHFWSDLRFPQLRCSPTEDGWLRILSREKQHFGLDHPQTLESQFKLANIYYLQGKLCEAERCCRVVLENSALEGACHHFGSLRLLAEIKYREGHHEEAVKALREALHVVSTRETTSPTAALRYRNYLTGVLYDEKRVAQAEAVWRDSVGADDKGKGPLFKVVLLTRMELGRLYLALGGDQGKIEGQKKANKQFELALEGYKLTLGEDHGCTREAKRCLDEGRELQRKLIDMDR